MVDSRTSDLELLASAIRSLVELQGDLRAAAGVSPDTPLLNSRGGYDRSITSIVADLRTVYRRLLEAEAQRWAAPKDAGTVELVLPEDDTLSGP